MYLVLSIEDDQHYNFLNVFNIWRLITTILKPITFHLDNHSLYVPYIPAIYIEPLNATLYNVELQYWYNLVFIWYFLKICKSYAFKLQLHVRVFSSNPLDTQHLQIMWNERYSFSYKLYWIWFSCWHLWKQWKPLSNTCELPIGAGNFHLKEYVYL